MVLPPKADALHGKCLTNLVVVTPAGYIHIRFNVSILSVTSASTHPASMLSFQFFEFLLSPCLQIQHML